jgi:hypothetical protein
MTDDIAEIIKIGGWRWKVNERTQSIQFLDGDANFTAAAHALADLAAENLRQLATVVEYIESLDDD